MDTRFIGQIVHRDDADPLNPQTRPCLPAITFSVGNQGQRLVRDLDTRGGGWGPRALHHDPTATSKGRGWHYPDECPHDDVVRSHERASAPSDTPSNTTPNPAAETSTTGWIEGNEVTVPATGHTLIRRTTVAWDPPMACGACGTTLHPGQVRIDVETPKKPAGLGHTAHTCSRICAVTMSQRLAETENGLLATAASTEPGPERDDATGWLSGPGFITTGIGRGQLTDPPQPTRYCDGDGCDNPLRQTATAVNQYADKLFCSAACASYYGRNRRHQPLSATMCPEHPGQALLSSDHHLNGPAFYRHTDGSGHLDATTALRTSPEGRAAAREFSTEEVEALAEHLAPLGGFSSPWESQSAETQTLYRAKARQALAVVFYGHQPDERSGTEHANRALGLLSDRQRVRNVLERLALTLPGRGTVEQIAPRAQLSYARTAKALNEMVLAGRAVEVRSRSNAPWSYRLILPEPSLQDPSETPPQAAPAPGPDDAPEVAGGPTPSP